MNKKYVELVTVGSGTVVVIYINIMRIYISIMRIYINIMRIYFNFDFYQAFMTVWKLGFPAEETFQEKMRKNAKNCEKFAVAFRNFFREISHFFAKNI